MKSINAQFITLAFRVKLKPAADIAALSLDCWVQRTWPQIIYSPSPRLYSPTSPFFILVLYSLSPLTLCLSSDSYADLSTLCPGCNAGQSELPDDNNPENRGWTGLRLHARMHASTHIAWWCTDRTWGSQIKCRGVRGWEENSNGWLKGGERNV